MKPKTAFLILSVLSLLFLLAACEKPSYEVSLKFSSVAGTTNGAEVKARLYDSASRLVASEAPSSATLTSGSRTFTLRTPDGSGTGTGTAAELKQGKYRLHVAVNPDADGRNFTNDGVVNFFNVEVDDADVTLEFSSLSQFQTPASTSITASGASSNGILYCFWFDSGVELYWGSFSTGQMISITSGSFTGGSGTASAPLSKWFGPVPGRPYNVYCFVDANANSIPDYASEYHGRLYGILPSGSHNLNLSIFVE